MSVYKIQLAFIADVVAATVNMCGLTGFSEDLLETGFGGIEGVPGRLLLRYGLRAAG